MRGGAREVVRERMRYLFDGGVRVVGVLEDDLWRHGGALACGRAAAPKGELEAVVRVGRRPWLERDLCSRERRPRDGEKGVRHAKG